MKKTICLVILLCALLACANIGVAHEANLVTAVIDGKTATRVHLREGQSTESTSLGLYFTGTAVLCEPDVSNEWVRVHVGNEAGYMKSEFLCLGIELESVAPRHPIGVANIPDGGQWINLRADPSLEGKIAYRISNDEQITILGENTAHWFYVKIGEQYGYILSDYVTLTELPAGLNDMPQDNG